MHIFQFNRKMEGAAQLRTIGESGDAVEVRVERKVGGDEVVVDFQFERLEVTAVWSRHNPSFPSLHTLCTGAAVVTHWLSQT